MQTIKKILEFTLITLIFYALYDLSLGLKSYFFPQGDPAIFVLASFLVAFLLLFSYRFFLTHAVKKKAKKEFSTLLEKKREKEMLIEEQKKVSSVEGTQNL